MSLQTADQREAMSDVVDELLTLAVQIAKPLAEQTGKPLIAIVGGALLIAFTRAHLAAFEDVLPSEAILTSVSLGFAEAAEETARNARQGSALQ